MGSSLEQELEWQMRVSGYPAPAREYRFHVKRRWRFDFAWPDAKVAAEVEGLSRTVSRHTTIKGYTGDCEKYNAAALDGWSVLRFTRQHIKTGYALHTIGALLGVGQDAGKEARGRAQ